MTPEIEALPRRAVACRGWRWMPGMAFCDGAEVWRVTSAQHAETIHADRTPDLTDPATLGCLLALVREAWGDPSAYTMAYCGRWTLCSDRDEEIDPGDGATEAAALVAALEAAP